MKILHTADWHIGKKLHKHDLIEDFDQFVAWLDEKITELQVDLLLVSGDVFDLANPSSEIRSQYYRTLLRLRGLNCKIILTGGNHDSPAMLNAPKEILNELDISVVGGMPETVAETLVPVKNGAGETELVVAAIPFLRDANLRSANDGDSYDDRMQAIRTGIEGIFKEAAALCAEKHSGVPAIAMGHLFAAGMETSESERDIQIGNLASFEAERFGSYFSYVALGHIHKPQRVNAALPVFYSGSPLPLSFSEQADAKRILYIDTTKGFIPESIPVPTFRKLIKISGDISSIRAKLNNLASHPGLDSLIEIELLEELYDAVKMYELDKLVSEFSASGYEIVKHRTRFSKSQKKLGALYKEAPDLAEMQPKQIFMKRISDHEYDRETQSSLLAAFEDILNEIRTES